MNIIALNGQGHSLARYFNPDHVNIVNERLWSRRAVAELSASITTPTALIGFSAGATAAMQVAARNTNVREVYAHSPMDPKVANFPSSTKVTLYITAGDTTPTGQGVWDAALTLAQCGVTAPIITLRCLDPIPTRRWIPSFIMRRNNHQFHNVLGLLDAEFRQPEPLKDSIVDYGFRWVITLSAEDYMVFSRATVTYTTRAV